MNDIEQVIELTLSDQKVDLPEIIPLEWDDGIETYRRGQLVEQIGWLVMGYAASGIEKSYGEDSLGKFANEVDTGYRNVAYQRSIYVRLTSLNSESRIQFLRAMQAGILRYKHFQIVDSIRSDDLYVKLLRQAHDENLNTSQFAELVAQERGQIPAPKLPSKEDEEAQANGSEVADTDGYPIRFPGRHFPDQDNHPLVQQYPWMRYEVSGRTSPEQLDAKKARLDAMSEEEREEALEKIKDWSPHFDRDFAFWIWSGRWPVGHPNYEGPDPSEEVPMVEHEEECPHCSGTGKITRWRRAEENPNGVLPGQLSLVEGGGE